MPANEPGTEPSERYSATASAKSSPGSHIHPRRFAPMARAAAAVCALALIAACGFHVRGAYDIPSAITPMHVEGAGGESVAGELRESLRRNAVELVSAPQAASRLVVSERSERQVLSVGSTGRVDEYELIYTVEWHLEAPEREAPLIPPERLEARRDYTHDPGAILGREDQEEALLEAMRSDLATRILFRLQAWNPSGGPPQ